MSSPNGSSLPARSLRQQYLGQAKQSKTQSTMFGKLKYDSNGTKYRKQEFDPGGNLMNDETYFGNLVLRNGRPFRILHDDGYVNLPENGLVGELNFHVKDHLSVDGQVLGNVRCVLSETPDRQPIIVQASGYYPFGMLFQSEQMQTSASANANKYLYNGKEVQDMPGGWYDYGARFYDAGLGRWFVVDAMAEKYYWSGSYTYAINNPLVIIDIDGNDIDVSNLYQKDKKGNYLYPDKIKAFEIFAKTDVGRQYLIDRAGKGQSIQGLDFNMAFKHEGKLSKEGIDVSFAVKDLSDKAGGIGADGLTETKIDGDRLKININLDKNDKLDTPDKLLDGVETIGHETLFHGDLNEKSFIKDGSLTNTTRHEKSDFVKSAYYKVGLNMLQQAQKQIGLNYSRDYLYYNKMLPGFNYATRHDIKK